MNEFLRCLRKVLRRFDYDIRKYGAYNLLPFKGVTHGLSLRTAQQAINQEILPVGAHSSLNSLKIMVRTCLREDRNVQKLNRVSGVPLVETVAHCLRSIVHSVNFALRQDEALCIELRVLDDHSDSCFVSDIEKILQPLNCQWSLQVTNERGQGKSLYQQFQMAHNDDALYYFCEDDYLHERTAIYEMWLFYKQIYQVTQQHLLLHPQESESLYTNYYPSYLLLSPYRHWRTMSHATHAFMTHSAVVKKYWHYFENTQYVGDLNKRHLGSESRTTNKIFEHLPGFCPIPALAGHLQSENTLPPVFDWRRLWDENKSLERNTSDI